MYIKSNVELTTQIINLIDQSGYKKTYLSDKLGIKNQNFNRLINKKNMSLDEANNILKILGYNAKIVIEKD